MTSAAPPVRSGWRSCMGTCKPHHIELAPDLLHTDPWWPSKYMQVVNRPWSRGYTSFEVVFWRQVCVSKSVHSVPVCSPHIEALFH
ncbi:hypothetical protein DUNSADRAFT_596 [Dunaliella salina]|uniref:Encoded protein n=1 Tax=Dunaliella salina TaxID=3046 RepID=A0ABQ7GY42_DUNSA|nr:hypothetical protein DUNSADRAFT_596 [Dunaliella salina]|eukprot:KAF5839525.1 hypothetical protein DUNSADRAFT_596 [Dunaliella salina]